MRRALVVTNDFPPRAGGIQAYVHELAIRQPPGSVVVFASTSPGAAEFDAAQPFPVVSFAEQVGEFVGAHLRNSCLKSVEERLLQ